MKNIKKYFVLLLGFILFFSCNNDDDGSGAQDEILEFVFFEQSEYSMNELINSSEGNELEIFATMLAVPRNEDIILTLSVTGENTEEGVDFEIVSLENIIVIPAGETISAEGFKLRTINNNASTIDERRINISIISISDPDLNIGERPTDPEKAVASVLITDDECSDTIELFNNAEWGFEGSNTVYYSDYAGSYVTTINGDKITISGDIANYDVGITITATLVPNPDAPTTGSIVYDPSSEGNDGTYDYRWVMGEEGSYDICSQTMVLSTTIQYIDIFGPDPTAWVDWYTSTITASITGEGSAGSAPPSGSVIENISSTSGESFNLTGSISDIQGLSSISIQNTELGISENITLSGEMMYELNEEFIVPEGTSDGNYIIEVIATNIETLSTTFTSILNVTSNTECTDDFTIFGNESLTAIGSISETDGTFEPYEYSNPVSTVIDGDLLTISGDLIDFFEMELTLTMVPDAQDPTIGSATFDIQDLGTHTDNFTYRIVQLQEGSYDACTKTITLFYDIEYEDSGSWVFYYRSEVELVL